MLQHLAPVCNYVDGLISLTKNWTNPGIAICNTGEVIGVSRLWMDLSFAPINIINRALINYLCPLPRSPLALPASSEIAPIQQQSIPSSWRKELQAIAIAYSSDCNNPTDPGDGGESPLPAPISEPEVAIAIPATLGIVRSKDLVAALVTVRKAVSSRSRHPIFSTVSLQSDGKNFIVTGTDLQTQIEVSLPDCGVDIGAVCLPPKLLLDALKKIKGEVSIAVISGELDASHPVVEIARGGSTIRLQGLSANDYPLIDAGCCTAKLAVDSEILLTIEQLKPAIACNETKACLNGIHFASLGDGMLRLSAADGHQIAQSSLNIGSSLLLDATVPASLFSSLKNVGNSLELSFFADYASLKSGNTCTLTKLCEPGFPDLANLQYDARQNLAVNRKALINQLQIALAYESKKPKVHLQANPIKQRLDLQMDYADVGNMAAWVQAENRVAAPSELSVNPDYLLDILKASKAEIVTLNLAAKYLKTALLVVLSGEVVTAIAALDPSKSSFQPKPIYQVPELDLETFNRAVQPIPAYWVKLLETIANNYASNQAIAPTLRLCPSPERLAIAA